MLHCLFDQVLTLFNSVNLVSSSQIVECSLVSVEKHLVLIQVNGFGRHSIFPNEGSNNNAETVFGGDRFVKSFIDAASSGPGGRLVLFVIRVCGLFLHLLNTLSIVGVISLGLGLARRTAVVLILN